MGVLIDWISQPQTAGGLLLVAMPGVGDVGKLAVDAVNSELDAEPVARIIHPSLPPLAKLDENGLLAPPHILLSKLEIDGKEITNLSPAEKLKSVGIAYILQDNSVFPDMTVEENLLMGGFIKDKTQDSYEEAERIFEKYERLRNRRNQPAKVLSGGERRLLEISRALVMKPSVLLVDEPSIGLEPRYIDMVFEILRDLQENEKKTIILVEQNAKKGLEFADIGYVLVSGQTAIAGKGDDLLSNPDVGRLFLGG